MKLLFKNLFFVALVPGTVAVYAPLAITWHRAPASGAALALAVALFAPGAAVALWCVWDFASFGRGTPAPIDPPKKLVTRGPYRVVRNPMYVGVLLVLLGWVALYQTLALGIYTAAVGIGFHVWTVLYEEPRLRRAFGAEYDDYCARVGRWLPRLGRWPSA